MTKDEPRTDLWTQLHALTDAELATAVECAFAVLSQWDEHAGGPSMLEMPASVVVSNLRAELDEQDLPRTQPGALVEDPALSRVLSLHLLEAIGMDQHLRNEIERAYLARGRMLAIDGGTIASVALLLLVLKLKRVKVGKGEFSIDFHQVSKEALALVRKMLGQ